MKTETKSGHTYQERLDDAVRVCARLVKENLQLRDELEALCGRPDDSALQQFRKADFNCLRLSDVQARSAFAFFRGQLTYLIERGRTITPATLAASLDAAVEFGGRKRKP